MPRHRKHMLRRAAVTVALEGVFDGEDTGPKWVQVTREGNFPGYLGGLKPFAFTRADLDAMVTNIKAHPAYELAADGSPVGKVIPWDFNHASEANPTAGNLPAHGAPSQGWTLDLEVRNGADGKAELWALTQFLEPARTYVKTGQYLWASVAVAFNAVHAETGQNIGALVTSIALTNTPFVEGMQKLVANRRGAQQGTDTEGTIELRRTWFEAARDPAEAISMMREMFALPETAGASEVMAQVTIVQQWLESGTAPLGTNPEEMVGNLRLILNLPALTSQLDVLQEAGKSIQALLNEQASAAGIPAPPEPTDMPGTVPEPPIAASRHSAEEIHMDELIKVLASILGVRENETSIRNAVTELAELRDGLKTTLGTSRDGVSVLLEAAKQSVDAAERLKALFAALDVPDPEAALAKVQKTMADAAQLAEVMPELADLREAKEKTDKAEAEADVDTAIAASKLPASMRGALLLQRQNDPEGFAKSFPKPAPGTGADANRHLLRAVTTTGPTPMVGGKVELGGQRAEGGDVIVLSRYPGGNPTAQAKAYLSTVVDGWDKMTNEQRFERALAFKQQSNVVLDA